MGRKSTLDLPDALDTMLSQHSGRRQHEAQANAGLVKRLSHTQSFKGHSSAVNALDWSSNGEILLSGGDDCRVKLWSSKSSGAMHSFDSGHTSSIYVAKFMPSSGNEQIITSAADRQVRLINLQRSAIKPYTFHHGRVKALVPLDQHMFMSGSDDGTVRHYDARDPASTTTIPGLRTGDLIADQRHERNPRGRAKVSINAVAVDPMRPHLFATGSSDPLVRLYDRRMSGRRGQGHSPTGRSWPQWVSCFVPTNLKTSSMHPRSSTDRGPFLTSIKFSVGGDQVFASYSGDHIYSFDCVDHARDSEDYCNAQGWSRPNSPTGTRSTSRNAILHASATAVTGISNGHANGTAADASAQHADGHPAQQNATTATQTDDAMGNGQRSIPHVAAAEGPTASSRPRSSGGGITPAAATAVAHIRRRRAAARSQQTHPHSSSAAAAAPAADTATVSAPAAAPNAAILNRPSLPHMANVASEQAIDSHCNAASTSPIDPSAAAPQQLQQAAAIQKGRDPMPSEVPDQAAANCTREGPPLDRALSVSRPPLPFHAIRRSARLHKTADRAPAGVSQPAARGQAELQMGGGQDADADMSFSGAKSHPEISGPCTRHSCKRKLAELSEATDVPSKRTQAQKAQQPFEPPSSRVPGSITPADPQGPSTFHGQQHSSAMHDMAQPSPGQAGTRQTQQDLTAPRLKLHQERATPGAETSIQDTQHAPPESGQQAAARNLRHCTSLHSMADAAEQCQNLQQGSAEAYPVDCIGQCAQREADSASAQNVEACVASTRRLEQPTASTGTSRPAPLIHAGTSVQTSQPGESGTLAPLEFLRLQYSTDPPSSADPSREPTPEQAAEAAQAAPTSVQEQASAAPPHDFTRPNRHTRRASRLAPLPATSTAHEPETTSPALPPLDPPEIVSRPVQDAMAQSQEDSQQGIGPAVSASAEARPCDGQEMTDGDCDGEPMMQPREGTPVSSNRRHYRARGRASVEASTAPTSTAPTSTAPRGPPTWHRSNSVLAHAEPSSANSPRGSYNHSTQPPAYQSESHQQLDTEAAGPVEDEVLSPHQSRLAETSPHATSAGDVASPTADSISHHLDTRPSCSSAQQPAAAASAHASALPRGGNGQMAAQHTVLDPLSTGLLDARPASACAALSDVEPSGLQAPHSVELPLPQARQAHQRGMARRSTTTADQPPSQTQSPIARAAAHSPPGAVGSCRAAAASPGRAESDSPNSSVLAEGPDHSAQGRQTNRSRDAQLQQDLSHDAELAGVVDSFVGAIMQEGSDDEGNDEVVEERGMFQQCYKGHCNLSHNKQVCLMGSRDEFVTSGSDDGRIFIWDCQTGNLVNILASDDQNVTCVAAHPSMPILASAGSEPVIKLWSPQAEYACNLDRAEAIMSQNARELAEGDRRSNAAGPPPMWLNMLGTVSAELRAPGEPVPARHTNPVRCTIM